MHLKKVGKIASIFIINFTLSCSNLLGQDSVCAIEDVIASVENDYPGFDFYKRTSQFNLYEVNKRKYLSCNHSNKLKCELNIFEYIYQFQDAHFSHYFNDNINKLKFETVKNIEDHRDLIGNWKYLPENNVFLTITLNSKKNLIGYTTVKYEDKIRRDTFLTFVPTKNKTEYILVTKIDSSCYYYSMITVGSGFLLKNKRLIYKRAAKINFTGSYKQDDTPSLIFNSYSNKANYLKISDLYYLTKNEIDSTINKHDIEIQSKPNLIIDFRDNFGGIITRVENLYNYISDGKKIVALSGITKPSDSLIVTIKNLCDKQNYFSSRKDSLYYCDTALNKWVKNIGKLLYEDPTYYSFPRLSFPKNIYFLMNKNTSSSAEMFIYAARKSAKVKVIGTNSSGVMDSGEPVRYLLKGNLELHIPSSVSEYIKTKKYDFIGMKPDIYLDFSDKSWRNKLEKIIDEKKSY